MRFYKRLHRSKSPVTRPNALLASALFLLLLAGGCRTMPPEEPGRSRNPEPAASTRLDTDLRDAAASAHLLGLMGQRLALMHEIARWKWAAGKPIADPARERKLLDRVARRGRDQGLDSGFTRRFFAAQIEAGKRVQQIDFDRWRTAMPKSSPEARNLALVRQDIDALNDRLIEALAATAPGLADSTVRATLKKEADRVLAGKGFSGGVVEAAMAPLLSAGTIILEPASTFLGN